MIYRSRKIVKNADLNGSDRLFGGQALAWIDEECAIFAMCQLNLKSIVTKVMSGIDFKAPAYLGDIIEIGCDVVKVGSSSITIKCTMRNKTTCREIITVDEIVFVNIGPDGKAAPHNYTKQEETQNVQ